MKEQDNNLAEELQKFYEELEMKQEPLGKEFQKVLRDNLFDLYIKD